MITLPDKWYIRRNLYNCIPVNESMSRLYGKTYTGNGISKLGNEDYMHYPAVKTKRYTKGRVSLPYANFYHTEITLETLQKYMENKKDYSKNWYVVVTDENQKKLSKWIDFTDIHRMIPVGGCVRMSFNGGSYEKGWDGSKERKCKFYSIATEISYDEFRFHILQEYTRQDWLDGRIAIKRPDKQQDPLLDSFMRECLSSNNNVIPSILSKRQYLIAQPTGRWVTVTETLLPIIEDIKEIYKNETMNNKTPIAYIAKSDFLQLAVELFSPHAIEKSWSKERWQESLTKNGFHFTNDSVMQSFFSKFGLLDQWFTPVYEKPKPQLPTIQGYKGEDKGNFIKFGCAELPKAWFKDSGNRTIIEMKLNSGRILTASNIADIRKYLENV